MVGSQVKQEACWHPSGPHTHLYLEHPRLWGERQCHLQVRGLAQVYGDSGRGTGGTRPSLITLAPWLLQATGTVPSQPTAIQVTCTGRVLWKAPLGTPLAVWWLSQVNQLELRHIFYQSGALTYLLQFGVKYMPHNTGIQSPFYTCQKVPHILQVHKYIFYLMFGFEMATAVFQLYFHLWFTDMTGQYIYFMNI